MKEAFQSIIALLDEGIALYRRNFFGFMLVTAACLVPVAIGVGLLYAAAAWRNNSTAVLIVTIISLLLVIPLTSYMIGGLSRAATAAIDGRPVRFREALAIAPLRAVGMGCFTFVYAFIAQIAANLLGLLCLCPLFFVGSALFGGLGALLDRSSSLGVLVVVLSVIAIAGMYALFLVLGGAAYSSLIYALQPWVQESRPFGEALQRSLELVTYRFWRNLLAWALTALLIAAAGLTITTAIGSLLPLPLAYALGSESRLAQAISLSAWVLGFVVILPPLPIWMALLYRRNAAARDGADLHDAIQRWWL
jgi:hypothetical protein